MDPSAKPPSHIIKNIQEAFRRFSSIISTCFIKSLNPCNYFQNVSLSFCYRKLMVPRNPLTSSFMLREMRRRFKTAASKVDIILN